MEFHNLNEENSSTQALHVSKRKKKRQHVCIYGFLIAALIGIMIGLAVGIPLAKRDSPDQHVQEAQNVLKQYPLIDGHNDLPWQYRQYVQNKVYEVNLRADTRLQWTNTTNMTSYDFPRLPPQTDIPRLKQGMVGAQFWAAFGPCSAIGKDAIRIGMDQVDVIHKFVNKYDDTFELVTTAQGILDAYLSRNRIASLIGLEGGHMISNTLGVLRSFYSLGVSIPYICLFLH